MRYRSATMLNENVAIWRRTTTSDSTCGKYPGYGEEPVLARYRCRVYYPETEKERVELRENREELWSLLGNPADIRSGDKVVRANGQEFTVTSVRQPFNRVVTHHLRALMRRTKGVSSQR